MKKIKLFVATLLVVMAGTFLFTNENLVKADESKETLIEEGVYIGGINVGGMTADEATAVVDAYVAQLQEEWIVLVGPKDTLRYQLKDLGLTSKTSAAVQEAIAIGNSGNLIKRFKDLQDLEKEDYVVDMGLSIDKQLTGNKINGKRTKIDIKAVDNAVKKENGSFVYVEGQEGNEVDIVPSVNGLNEYIATDWEMEVPETAQYTLTSVVSQPRGTEEQLAVIKDLIGSFTTDYKTSAWGRVQNVENGAAKINGTVLYPGDEFSVYETVSPFTQENGYELAGAYSDGETIESFGGGICQVSTTLYNAVLNAELEITKRYNHSMVVTYVDPAADAAIAGTYKDLRFVNNYDFPIYIEAYCKNKTITFNIYGVETRASNRVVTYESEIISIDDPDTEYTLSSSYAVGTYTKTRSEHIGYVAKYWKVVTVDGVETERTQMNRSTYQTSCKKVTIGTKGATEEQLAAIKAALATKDDDYIKTVVTGLVNPTTPTTPDTSDTSTGTTPTTPDTGNTGTTTPSTEEDTTTPGTGEGTGTGNTENPETGADDSTGSN